MIRNLHLLLFTVLLLPVLSSSAQRNSSASLNGRDSIINKSISELQKHGVDTIAVYSVYALPFTYIDQLMVDYQSPCTSQWTFMIYIIWQQHGKNYLTFKTSCFNYPVIPLDDVNLWKFYSVNVTAIEQDTVKNIEVKKVNVNTEQVSFEKVVLHDHFQRQAYTLLVGSHKIVKDFPYELYSNYDRFGNENINYTYNLNLKAKQLQLMLDEICKRRVKGQALIHN